MEVKIEFFKGVSEQTVPIIRLTKSKSKTTGTATFIFINPHVFSFIKQNALTLEEMSLLWSKNKISTQDISILFNKGKPFLIKSIFIFKNSKDWFEFLNFMKYYSEEFGLGFTKP